MKLHSLNLASLLALVSLFTSAEAKSPASPPSTQNTSSSEPCGNPKPSEPPYCKVCIDGIDYWIPAVGSSCETNSILAYSGNAHREITDLAIAGSVGMMPLEFQRYSNTRLSGRNLAHSAFGPESSWSHNYEWVMRDSGGTAAQPVIKITYPEGGEMTFKRYSATSTTWLPERLQNPDRLINTGDDFVLQRGDLSQCHFKRRTHSVNGGVFYRIESIKDSESNTYTVSYQNNDDTLIRQITDPAGHWLKLHYNDLSLRTNGATILNEQLLPSGSSNVWKEVILTPGEEFRILALYQGNTWRQATPLRVAELEFYDENNTKITSGTTFGSWPWATNADPSKSRDGNTSTYYEYMYEKAGYVGIDLGASTKKKVSKIRFRLTGTINSDASVTFVGMNNEPTPNYVISHVEGSDGRQVGYDYNIYTEPSGIFQWAQLTAANYSDLTESAYTYKWQHRHVMPVLETANDPRYTSPVKHVRYGYDLNTVVGFVVDEYDNTTNQLVASVRWDGGHLPKLVYPNGKANRFEYSNGMLTRAIDAFGGVTDFTYTWNGYVLSKDDPLGRVTTYTRRADGRVLSSTSPGGNVITYTRDAAGYVTAVNKNGNVTSYILDAAKRRTRSNYPDGTYETWTYNSFGQKLTHRLRNATTESWTYNAAGLLTHHTDATGLLTTYTYNALNRLANQTRHLSATVTHTTSFLYNDRGQITQVTHPDSTFVQHEYDTYGHRVATFDERSQVTFYTYDSLGRKLTETDPNGNVTSYDYTSALGGGCGCNTGALPVLTTYPDGSVTLNQYDKEWRLIATTHAFGTPQATTTSFTYDLAGQRSTMTDHLGSVTTYTYDLDGRLATVTQASGTPLATTTQNTYSSGGNLIESISAFGTPIAVTTKKNYDAMDRNISTTVAFGTPSAATSSVTYNTLGQMITSTDPLGRVTSYIYDSAGRKLDEILPYGKIKRRAYDAASRVTTSSHLQGNTVLSTTTYTYDNRDRLLTSTSSDGMTATYGYDSGGLTTSITRNGVTTSMSYDGNGNRLTSTIAPGTAQTQTTSTTYDVLNRPIIQIDSLGNVTTTTYDKLGRTISMKNGLNQVTNISYTRNTTTKTETTVSTNPAGQADTTVTNALGQTQSVKNANNETTTYYYDALGRQTAYVDPKGATFSFQYDPHGRRTRRTEPDATYQAYTYDLVGNMLTHRKADGSVATITYNTRNQPDLKTWSGSTEFTDWSYDAQGRLTNIANQDVATAYTYHGTTQRVATETTTSSGIGRTVTRAFDANFRLSAVTSSSVNHSLSYGYEATTGRLQTINNDGPPPLATYGYLNGHVHTLALENGLTTTTVRDAALQVTSHSTASGASVKSSVAHGYDAAGRRKYAQYEDSNGQAYHYDSAGQIKNVVVNTATPATTNATVSSSHAYYYDLNGNRTSVLDTGLTTNYSSNSVNAYTSITGSTAPTYDLNGNMLTGPVEGMASTLVYDKENRLRSITRNSVSTSHRYDALGRIIETSSNASTNNLERYTWSGWTLLSRELFTGTTATTAFRYTWGLDLSGSIEGAGGVGGLLAIERNVAGSSTWDIRFPHCDANGNIIALTNSAGNVSARYRYDAFGKTIQATDVDGSGWVSHNIHGFSSKPTFGGTGLLYYGYRWFSPTLGRWINRDPIEESGGMNLYGFLRNDGVNELDVLGLDSEQACEDALKAAADDPRVKSIRIAMTKLTPKCPEPPVKCKTCCDDNKNTAEYNRLENTIVFCAEKFPVTNGGYDMDNSYASILYHEFIHAYQKCTFKQGSMSNCRYSMCKELQAYYNANCKNSPDPKACAIFGAKQSAAKSCDGGTDLDVLAETIYEECVNPKPRK
jgi:RHS repeat-associated protein